MSSVELRYLLFYNFLTHSTDAVRKLSVFLIWLQIYFYLKVRLSKIYVYLLKLFLFIQEILKLLLL
jgi:hypothetical protein